MQQMAQVLVAVALVASLAVAATEAKRGCLKYGHSCLGGHGKRSELPLRHDQMQPGSLQAIQNFFGDCKDEQMQDIPDCVPKPSNSNKFMRLSQEIAYPTNNHLGPNSKDIAKAITEQRKMQFAFYNLVRQMMNNARKAHEDSSSDLRSEDSQQLI